MNALWRVLDEEETPTEHFKLFRSFCVSLKGMLIMSVELLDDYWCKSDPATWTREDEGDVYA